MHIKNYNKIDYQFSLYNFKPRPSAKIKISEICDLKFSSFERVY